MFDFMSIAKTLELSSLMEEICLLLKNSLNRENVVLIFEKAFQYGQKMLKESCERLIDQHAEYLVAQKSLTKLSSQCLQEIISRDSFGINEMSIFELVNDWHVHHNRTENLENDLIKKIRFELFSNKELFNLTHHSNMVDKNLVFEVLKERHLHENTKMPTRLIHITTTTTKTIPNNKLVSGSEDKSIKIWNVDTGECIRTLTDNASYVYSLQLLDNNKLASGSSNSIRLWNIDTGECIRTLTGHSDRIWSLQLLKNNQLASASDDKSIKIWNINNGECLRTLTNHSNGVRSLLLLPNNKLASGSADTTIKICIQNKINLCDFGHLTEPINALLGESNTIMQK